MNSKKNLTARYAVVQGLYWMSYCILGGFANVYLLAHDFSNTAIGFIVALSGIISAVISPVIAAYLDRRESMSVKKALTLMSFGMLVLVLLIAVTGRNYIQTVVTYTAAMTLIQMMASLLGSLATQSMRSGWSVNYGLARGTGSLTYGLLAHTLSFLVARFRPDVLPVAAAVIWAVTFFYLYKFPDTKDISVMYANETQPAPSARQGGSPIAFFRRYPRYGLFLLGIFFVYISHAVANVFVTQVVISKGGTSADTGLILGVQALVEIPVMFGFSKMLKVAKVHSWMRICAIVYVLKIFGTFAVTTVGGLVAVQFLELGSYAVMVVSSLYYVNSIMRTEDCVKGQSYFGISTTVANVVASWLGGMMLDAYGVHITLLAGIAVAVLGMVIVFFGAESPKAEISV